MNLLAIGSLPKICICREPLYSAFTLSVIQSMCQGIVKYKVADKVSDNADKIKGIKIWEAIKCRILPILIPVI